MVNPGSGAAPSRPTHTGKIAARVGKEAGVPDLIDILSNTLSPADLQSLMLEVYSRRAKSRTPKALMAAYTAGRFGRPSSHDSRTLLEWDKVAFSCLPSDFQPVELSPVVPLGTVSAVAPVSQFWIVSTVRNVEVISDPTNAMAMECALRRSQDRSMGKGKSKPVHLAASSRVVRAQKWSSPKLTPHFKVFSLCSAGRGSADFQFESDAVATHTRFYLQALRKFLGPKVELRVRLSDSKDKSPRPEKLSAAVNALESEFKDVKFTWGEPRTNPYYGYVNFSILTDDANGEEMDLTDGGDVNWTQKLLTSAKERLVISGIGSERVCGLFTGVRCPK